MVFWTIVSIYQYMDNYTVLLSENCVPDDHDHWPIIKEILISLVVGGSLLGSALVFLWERWLRNMAFSRAMASITLYYTSLFLLLTYLLFALMRAQNSDPGEDTPSVLSQVFDIRHLPNFMFWLFIMLLTMAVLLVRDKFGPGVFSAFIRGKYFRPKREERIFMFMDLKSSTTIAEKLGEEKYFNFLNDTFKTATPGILATKGEIYQYVGDEVVVSWPIKAGIHNANCIQCFYEMTKLLEERSSYFQNTYGIRPEFKAGIHSGYVIAGEMGAIKREIAYSGDVLNTTARIQAKCNDLKTSILISETLIQQIGPKDLGLESISLGALNLKGKTQEVAVVTLR